MNDKAVIGEFLGGHIARLTTFESEDADPEHNTMVWHTAQTSKGTSGSPIFNRKGEVIALNNSGYGTYVVYGTDVYGNEGEQLVYSAEGFSAGIRVDILESFLVGLDANMMTLKSVPSTITPR